MLMKGSATVPCSSRKAIVVEATSGKGRSRLPATVVSRIELAGAAKT